MKNNISLIGALLCLFVAGIFIFIFPNSGAESIVVGLLGTIFPYFGYDWRTNYLEIKSWVKSKSIWGVILVGVPALLLIVLPYFLNIEKFLIFGINIHELLIYIIIAGGGTFLIGAAHANTKKTKEIKNVE